MAPGPEYNEVEKPLIDQLITMGWQFTEGTKEPRDTRREELTQVLLLDDVRDALRRINLDAHGQPWLDDSRINGAIQALERPGGHKLLEANEHATQLLLEGITVDPLQGQRKKAIHYIDWEHPERNTFRVINQFWTACPPGQPHKHIAPDLVLFVNGIPLVVIECKSPYVSAPLESAIDQLQRYANRRVDMGLVECPEGQERLFYYNQFMIATCGEQARVGTFTSLAVHYLEWKDTSPKLMSEVAQELGKPIEELTSQEILVAGMLRPEHLLDIVRHFTLFKESDNRKLKVVCRYQQFRAVQQAIARLASGKTREQDGEHDRRGGLIWHTQGSGKSLTMVFLIRKMRSHRQLRAFKVVVVTDRRDLQDQLSETAQLVGETLSIVESKTQGQRRLSGYDVLLQTLAQQGRDLVFTMIQKYNGEQGEDDADGDDNADLGAPSLSQVPVVNEDEKILVLVDEAHRSHTSVAHATLMKMLPNCAKIGFTGTPIIMGQKKRTQEIFGPFIDRYTIRQSEADGATVPILYEGRTARASVDGDQELDGLFIDMFVDYTPEELERIKRKYATTGHIMEAPSLIAAKAKDMLHHYVEHILPNGFKAQVVAYSRLAVVRYVGAFESARDELVAELELLEPAWLTLEDEELVKIDQRLPFLVRAHRFLDTIKRLEVAAIISSAHNDTVDPDGEWSNRPKINQRIARFKKPLFVGQDSTHKKADTLSILVVKSMLLTGFDAPIEQALYLDRPIREAELLQAIARVNRTCTVDGVEKRYGMVVDYYGVASHLKEALAAYSEEDVDGALQSLKDELPKLRDQYLRVLNIFKTAGKSLDDINGCVAILRDERLRAEFKVALKRFLGTMDTVLPRPEALPYTKDAKQLALIQARAHHRYRTEERLIGKEVGQKVRELIDEYLIAEGIDIRIAPIELTSEDFRAHVRRQGDAKEQASEMEHALRYHITKHLDEDPVFYESLSERLDQILTKMTDKWEELAQALEELVTKAEQGRRKADDSGVESDIHAPYFDLIHHEGMDKVELNEANTLKLHELTQEIVAHIRQEITLVNFWQRPSAMQELQSWLVITLDDSRLIDFDKLDALASKLMQLTKANHTKLTS